MGVNVLEPECLHNRAALPLFSLGQASVESGFEICAEAKMRKQRAHTSHSALMRSRWMGGCTKPIHEEWHTKYVP